MDDVISRRAAIDAVHKNYDTILDFKSDGRTVADSFEDIINALPFAQSEIIRCKDCIFGHLYIDVQNGVTDSWIECRNPEGLYRDVSVDGYCSASIRRT